MMSMTQFEGLVVPGIRGEFYAAYARFREMVGGGE